MRRLSERTVIGSLESYCLGSYCWQERHRQWDRETNGSAIHNGAAFRRTMLNRAINSIRLAGLRSSVIGCHAAPVIRNISIFARDPEWKSETEPWSVCNGIYHTISLSVLWNVSCWFIRCICFTLPQVTYYTSYSVNYIFIARQHIMLRALSPVRPSVCLTHGWIW